MTWIMEHAWWLILSAVLAGIIGGDQIRRVTRQHNAEARQLGADLDALAPLPPLPEEDPLRPDADASAGVAAGPPPVPAGGAVPDAGAALLYGRTPDRLTSTQRRRAVRKGRIPRDLPGRVAEPQQRRPAPAGEHHPTLDDLRHDEYAEFWSQLARDRDHAYQAWADGFARLENVNWLELAA